jgi:hypothetical protein
MLLGTGSIGNVAFAVVVNGEHGPVGLAVTGFPDRVQLDASIGPSDLPGTAGLFNVSERIAALLEPVALLNSASPPDQGVKPVPERLPGADLQGDPRAVVA